MPIRKGHSKSRNGCRQCKLRHVRCDQQHPKCGLCQQRKQSCSFAEIHSPLRNVLLLPNLIAGGASLVGRTVVSDEGTTRQSRLPLKELELLHHFTSVVSVTLGEYSFLQDMWRNDIPREALKHEFLMYAILAISAVHIHSTKAGQGSSRQYRNDALHYYDLASTQFRFALQKSTTDACDDALFASSALLSIFVLSSRIHLQSGDGSLFLNDIATFCNLGKGIRAMADTCLIPSTGVVQPLMNLTPWDDVKLSSEMQSRFSTLLAYAEASTEDESKRKTYRAAIRAVQEPLEALLVNPGRSTLVFYFYVVLESNFVPLLEQRDPTALVTLAYHTVLLDEYKHYWYVGQRGCIVLREIMAILGPSYQSILAWPAEILRA